MQYFLRHTYRCITIIITVVNNIETIHHLPVKKNIMLSRLISLVSNSVIEAFSSCLGFTAIIPFFTSFSLPSASNDGRKTIRINVPKAHTTANTVNTKLLTDSSNSLLSRSTNIINIFPTQILYAHGVKSV